MTEVVRPRRKIDVVSGFVVAGHGGGGHPIGITMKGDCIGTSNIYPSISPATNFYPIVSHLAHFVLDSQGIFVLVMLNT